MKSAEEILEMIQREKERNRFPSGMGFGEMRERYFNDIQFHSMVDMFVSYMSANKIEPYMVRDAAYMAELKFRELYVVPMFAHKGEL